MGRFFALLRFQIKTLFISPSTYAATFLFTLLIGLIYFLILQELGSENSKNSVEIFLSLFWIPVLFMVPMLTMRSIAEERKLGTLQAVLTARVSAFELVLAKFLACYFVYVFMWVLTAFFPIMTSYAVSHAAIDDRIFSVSSLISSYVFIFVSGAAYVAVGIFSSSLTRSTFVAGMLAFCLLFIMILGPALIVKIPVSSEYLSAAIESASGYVQPFKALEDFSGSVLDTRPFFFYFSLAAVLVGATSLITEYKAS